MNFIRGVNHIHIMYRLPAKFFTDIAVMGMSIFNLIEHIVFRMRDEAHMFLELYVA